MGEAGFCACQGCLIVRELYSNCTGIVRQLCGNSAGIVRELYGEVCLGVYIEYDDDGSKDALWYGNRTAMVRGRKLRGI